MKRILGALLIVVGIVINVLLAPGYGYVFVYGLGGVSVRLVALVVVAGLVAWACIVSGYGLVKGRVWANWSLLALGFFIVVSGPVVAWIMREPIVVLVSVIGVLLMLLFMGLSKH